ncbi:MAG: 16S rRNA (cytidine(1402)-2'-O)-methyltransferase, partial [Myxococcota bacterium]
MDNLGTLYLVPTPLGHDDDITRRALHVLADVDLIAAEDTRSAARLLAHHGLGQPLISYHDHNEHQRLETLLRHLHEGSSIALISEAGTPLISDPGFRIVQAAIEADIPVVSLPGPSAPIAALVASGLPVHSFCFLGFPPRKARQRRTFWTERTAETATLILFEAPHRALESLTDALDILGDRPMALVRNLTKPHEEILRGPLSEVCAELQQRDRVLG